MLFFKAEKQKGNTVCIWDFHDVRDDVIYMNDGSFRMCIEVFSANFDLLDEKEKLQKISGFEKILREVELSFPLRILIQTRTMFVDDYVDYLKDRYEIEGKDVWFNNYSNFLKNTVKEDQIISKRFYLILQFNNPSYSKKTADFEKLIRKDLLQKLKKVEESFSSIDVKTRLLGTDEIIKVMMTSVDEDLYLNNRKFYTDLDLQRRQSKSQGLPFDIVTKISPDSIEVVDRETLLINNKYFVSSEFISDIGSSAYIDWLKEIVLIPHSSDIVISYFADDVSKTLRDLQQKRGRVEAKRWERQKNNIPNDVRDELMIESIEELERKYHQSEIKPINLKIDISFIARDKESLNTIKNSHFESILNRKLMKSRSYLYEQIKGFKSTFIGGMQESDTQQFRDINTDVASYTFPFIVQQINNRSGILYGLDMSNNSLVIVDRQKVNVYNYNRCIIADSGAGKSFFVKLDLIRSNMIGYHSFVLDPENEYESVTCKLNGKYVIPNAESEFSVSPFYLSNKNFIAQKIGFIKNLFLYLCRKESEKGHFEIPSSQIIEIERAIREVYDRFESRNDHPLLKDFVNELENLKGGFMQEVVKILSYYTEKNNPKYYLFNKQQNIDFSKDKVIAFGLKYVDEKELVSSILLEQYWGFVHDASYSKVFKNLVIDEAHHLFSYQLVAEKLVEIARRGRKYNCGITTITQSIEHYFKNASSGTDDLFNQASLALFMKHKLGDSFNKLSEKVHLSEPERQFVEQLEIGCGLLVMNNSKIRLKVVAGEEEKKVIEE